MASSSVWLALSSCNSELILEEYIDALRSLAWCSEREPRVIALCGYGSKPKYFKAFLGRSIRHSGHGQVRLFQDKKSRASLVVDFELLKEFATKRLDRRHAQSRTLHPSLQRTSRQQIAGALFSRVIGPFADVTCYLAADLGGLPGVALLLADQVCAADDQPQDPAPGGHIVVVVESYLANEAACRQQKDNTNLREKVEDILRAGDQASLTTRMRRCAQLMSNLSIFHVSQQSAVVPKPLSDHIIREQDRVHYSRSEQGLNFEHRHLTFLLTEALESFCHLQPFCVLKAAHPAGNTLEYKQQRLRSVMPELLCLLKLQPPYSGEDVIFLYDTDRVIVLSTMIAASIILISCPPGSHLFQLTLLYEQLFRNSILEGLTIGGCDQTLQSNLQTVTKERLKECYLSMKKDRTKTGKQVHRSLLTTVCSTMAKLRTNVVCLSCLVHPPERLLRCGHTLCETCIRVWGHGFRAHAFRLTQCPLCCREDDQAAQEFYLMPPTAGVRLLTIDGGGVKGIVPLTYLVELEKQLAKYKMPLRDHFDLVCGTSAGGLIALGIVTMEWEASICVQMFKKLAQEMFAKRAFGYSQFTRILTSVIRLLLAIRRDYMYDPQPIERAFTNGQSNGNKLNLLSTGTRVAVATTIAAGKPHPYLFTNYIVPSRGGSGADDCRKGPPEQSGDDATETSYGRLAPQEAYGTITVAQAAMATAAAPWLFPPVQIPSVGLFQDGGLHYNNPAQLADWEAQALWPEHKVRDFELSLGTGYSQGILRSQPKFLRRLVDSMLHNMDGQKIHNEYIRNRSRREKERAERFNFDYGFPEPALDDCNRMDWLQTETYRHISLTDSVTRARDGVLSSLFYFELDCVPALCLASNGKSFWQCSGHVACRNRIAPEGYAALVKDLKGSFFSITEFYDGDNDEKEPSAAPLGQPARCLDDVSDSELYRRPLKFAVRSLDNELGITLSGITSQARSISGFPTSVNKLCKLQRLRAPFGRSDHYVGKPLPAIPAKARKRKMSFEKEGSQPTKMARFL